MIASSALRSLWVDAVEKGGDRRLSVQFFTPSRQFLNQYSPFFAFLESILHRDPPQNLFTGHEPTADAHDAAGLPVLCSVPAPDGVGIRTTLPLRTALPDVAPAILMTRISAIQPK